jgi:hypothetical protein
VPPVRLADDGERLLLDQLDVGHERRPGIPGLEQVVAQDEVLGESPFGRGPEGVDVVDPLADERALPEEVLVNVRHLVRIGIDPAFARDDLREEGASRAPQADRDARLQDSVPPNDAALLGVVDRPVERMREVSDELARGIPGKLRVRVERDHVADRRQDRAVADHLRERVGRLAPQVRVQLLELSALALVAHPETLVGIPDSIAVEQVEDRPGFRAVLRVQCLDPFARGGEERPVGGRRALGCVVEIGQQREEQIGIAIPQVPDLQGLDHRRDAGGISEERRDHHERAVLGRDPFREVQAREPLRGHDPGHDQVHDRDREGRGGEEPQDGQKPRPLPRREPDRRRHHDEDGAEVDREPLALAQAAPRAPPVPPGADGVLETSSQAAHQRVADVDLRFPGQTHRLRRDLRLARPDARGQLLDGPPVAVPRREVLVVVDPGRVVAESALDQAHGLHELLPVHRVDRGEAADAVPHRDPVGPLRERVGLEEPGHGRAALHELLLDPRQDERQRWRLPLEPFEQLLDEGCRKVLVRLGELGEQMRQPPGRRVGRFEQLLGPGDRGVAVRAPPRDPRGHAAEVLQECQAQHDRKRPELAERKRLHLLIGRDVPRDGLGVHAAVQVGDQLEGHVVDPREPGICPAGQLRQLPAVLRRKVAPRERGLLLDEVEVVEEPLRRERDPPSFRRRLRDDVVCLAEHALVVVEPREQPVRPTARLRLVKTRQGGGVVS